MQSDHRAQLNELFQAIGVVQLDEPRLSKEIADSATEEISIILQKEISFAGYSVSKIELYKSKESVIYSNITASMENGWLVELLSVSVEGIRKTKHLQTQLLKHVSIVDNIHEVADFDLESNERLNVKCTQTMTGDWHAAHKRLLQSVADLLEFFENSVKLLDQKITTLLRQ